MICFVFVLFFAPNVKILVLGEVLCGMFKSCLILADGYLKIQATNS